MMGTRAGGVRESRHPKHFVHRSQAGPSPSEDHRPRAFSSLRRWRSIPAPRPERGEPRLPGTAVRAALEQMWQGGAGGSEPQEKEVSGATNEAGAPDNRIEARWELS